MWGPAALVAAHLALVATGIELRDAVAAARGNSKPDGKRIMDSPAAAGPVDLGFTLEDPDPPGGGARELLNVTTEGAAARARNYPTPMDMGLGETLYERSKDPECRQLDWNLMASRLFRKAEAGETGNESWAENEDGQSPSDAFSEEDLRLARGNVRRALHASSRLQGARFGQAYPQLPKPTMNTLGSIVGHCQRGEANVVFPPDYNASEPLPLILHLHGFMQNPPIYLQAFNFPYAAEIEKLQGGMDLRAIHVVPWGKALRGRTAWRFWKTQAGQCCDYPWAGLESTCNQDDLGYLKELLKAAVKKYNVDTRRVYLVGFSNGGYMADVLSCALSDMVTATATIAGVSTGWCNAKRPVPRLMLHGINDQIVRYTGGRIWKTKPHVGADATALSWAQVNNCREMLEDGKNLFPADVFSTAGVENETRVKLYFDCDNSTTVELWSVPGMGHLNITTFATKYPERGTAPLQEMLRWLWRHERAPGATGAFELQGEAYGEHWSKRNCLRSPPRDEQGHTPEEQQLHRMESLYKHVRKDSRKDNPKKEVRRNQQLFAYAGHPSHGSRGALEQPGRRLRRGQKRQKGGRRAAGTPPPA